jgi:hypothetical protein
MTAYGIRVDVRLSRQDLREQTPTRKVCAVTVGNGKTG